MNLGIIGAPGAGKDTLANYLVENKGYIRLAFADQIKKEYYAISGYTEEKFKARDGTEQKIRDGLWAYSTEMKKKNGEMHFITPLLNQLSSQMPVVITDIRTHQELAECQKRGVLLFVVIRDLGKETDNGRLSGTKLNHPDIMHLPIFWNDSNSLEETYRNFDEFLNTYGGNMDPESNKYHST